MTQHPILKENNRNVDIFASFFFFKNTYDHVIFQFFIFITFANISTSTNFIHRNVEILANLYNFFFNVLSPTETAQPVSGTSSPAEEDDQELFSDQPCSIGVLGRVAADHCVPLLARWGSGLEHYSERPWGHRRSPCVSPVNVTVSLMTAACWRTACRGCTASSRGPGCTSRPRLIPDQRAVKSWTTSTRTSTGCCWSQVSRGGFF